MENSTYGWFWVCPNEKETEKKCLYRHALPPGFQLKSDKKKLDEKEEIALETLIETERSALGPSVTKVTLESFIAWKLRKIQEKKDKISETEEKKKRDFKLGFMNGLTGRDIFTFNPDLIANDDDEANNDIDYSKREGEDEENKDEIVTEVKEINLEFLTRQATEVDGSGTIATSDRFDYIKTLIKPKANVSVEETKLDMACGGGGGGGLEDIEDEDEEDDNDDKNKILEEINNQKPAKNIEIDESLFNLEDIQDELENLDI